MSHLIAMDKRARQTTVSLQMRRQTCIPVTLCLPMVCFVVSVLSGCGQSSSLDTIPVGGRVIYEGKPLTIGEVRYLPKDAAHGRVARGEIQSDGSFKLTTLKANDGVLAGEYRVVVVIYAHQFEDQAAQHLRRANENRGGAVVTKKPRSPIPARYYRPESSGLTDTVDDNHSGHKKIELTK